MLTSPQSSALGLKTYTGVWNETLAKHLLNRTTYGATKSTISNFTQQGMLASVNQLLQVSAVNTKPLNDYATATLIDPNVSLGSTWVNDITNDGSINSARRNSYKKWLISVLFQQENNIQEKLTTFWSNHFGTEADTIVYGSMIYQHHQILRTNCLGNFKQMVRAVTTDPGMLRYLNGYLNTKSAPDENYGRELQELFTVGKDGGAKYAESDVKMAAKVLTGWKIDASFNAVFDSTRHDVTNKTFSAYYNNTTIVGKSGAAGATETDELLDMVFQNMDVAKFICRKIYRYFVYYYIDDIVEQQIITPLAQTMITNNYDIKPVLKLLFESEHFYDTIYIGCQIKSPLDHVIGFLRTFGIVFPDAVTNYADAYFLYNTMVNQLISMGQSPVDPPNVAGWPAYYQSPDFNELWINADTLPKRNKFTDLMLETGYTKNGNKIIVNTIQFAKTICGNPADPNALIDCLFSFLLSTDLDAAFKNNVKTQILLSGQASDYYWMDAWNLYITNPSTINYNIVHTRLKTLLKYIMNLPDYQLQ